MFLNVGDDAYRGFLSKLGDSVGVHHDALYLKQHVGVSEMVCYVNKLFACCNGMS